MSTELDDRDRRIAALEDRLARLSEASLRINDSLDPDAVLQRVLDSARSLTGAGYGVMTTLDEQGRLRDFLASGMTPEEAQRLWTMPGGMDFFEYLRTVPGPLRLADFAGHTKSLGLPEFLPPAPMSSFLSVPIRHRENEVGSIYVAKGDPARSSAVRMRRRWRPSLPRPPWSSPTLAGTGTSSAPGPPCRPWWRPRRWGSWYSTP